MRKNQDGLNFDDADKAATDAIILMERTLAAFHGRKSCGVFLEQEGIHHNLHPGGHRIGVRHFPSGIFDAQPVPLV